jgi:dipeptidyl aminopeptidase/acylaminoacyl peptidase
MKYTILAFILCVASLAMARPMTVEDMWAMKRISDVQLSPDGKWLAYSIKEYDMQKNNSKTDIWLLPANGGEPRQMTFHEKSSSSPRWKPDGSGFAFLSARVGQSQIFYLSLKGGEAQQLTDFPVDVESFIWSPNGEKFALTATVFADASSLQESAERDKEKTESAVQAKIIDNLLFRSWDRWTDGKHTHVFVCQADGSNPVDVTPGKFDSPPLDLGGHQDFVFSPDGKTIAFVSNRSDMPAANTNNDVLIVSADGRDLVNVTVSNQAVDNQPIFLPDGEHMIYKAMARPVFEADQYEIVLHNIKSGASESLTESLDLSPDEIIASPDGKTLYFNTREKGRSTIYSLEIKSKKITKRVADNVNSKLSISPDCRTLYFTKQSNVMPYEIFALNLKKETIQQLSFVNKSLLDELEMNPVEDFSFKSFDGKMAHGFLTKPPNFDPEIKYPLVYLIHGGPQGMWSDQFHYRWNISMFSAPGYVVAAVNFRGSKGYGQEWCDAVSKDWGGGPYQDLMTGLDYVLDTFDFIDDDKLCAAGASYGGTMVNWIAAHSDRFSAMVSHDGVFDQKSMYGATEELWFPEWEFGGTPYENPELYEKWSPSTHAANYEKYKTPILVIHGQRDFRVPVTQSFQLFTALQRYNVPSRLLYFPDETHFVTKPQNAKLWWSEVFGWFEKWINE